MEVRLRNESINPERLTRWEFDQVINKLYSVDGGKGITQVSGSRRLDADARVIS